MTKATVPSPDGSDLHDDRYVDRYSIFENAQLLNDDASAPPPKIKKFNRGGSKNKKLKTFIQQYVPKIEFYWHVDLLVDYLQAVADNQISRLMIYMPPRHGKSEITSRIFSAYYLWQNQDQYVGLTSYSAELARTFSRTSRERFELAGGRLSSHSKSVNHWETEYGGGLWAAGVGGSITGKGADLAIIDDPVKNALEASSPTIQSRNREWYDSTFYSRLEPNSKVIVIATRWNKRDLPGYVISSENNSPERWHVIHLEAQKTSRNVSSFYPSTMKLGSQKLDGRKEGEALCPPRYPVKVLDKIKSKSTYFWNALYQQRPTARKGRVYYSYDEVNNVVDDISQLNYKAMRYFLAMDFGGVNETYGIFGIRPSGKFILLEEGRLPNMPTRRRANFIKAMKYWPFQRIFGGGPSETQIRRNYMSYGLHIEPPRIAFVDTQIDDANEMLESGRVQIYRGCDNVIDQLENCIRADDGSIIDKARWHFLDMFRYFCHGVYVPDGGFIHSYTSTSRFNAAEHRRNPALRRQRRFQGA